jgi:hypothetical protein
LEEKTRHCLDAYCGSADCLSGHRPLPSIRKRVRSD